MTRCGWCISGDCENCIIVIKMGTKAERGHPIKKGHPYFWLCKCQECIKPTKCVDCQRLSVDIDESWRCRNREACAACIEEYGVFKRPKPPQLKESDDAA